MVSAMLLAHLVGDYVLQWDSLAGWKSRELKGVTAHCLVVTAVTWLISLPFDSTWWRGILFICVAHFFIDAVQLYVRPPISALARFTLDQAAHFLVIALALFLGGYLQPAALAQMGQTLLGNERLLLILTGYAFVTMPAWVLAKFLAYGLVQGAPPNFPEGSNKYLGILERLLITTFVALGQLLLVPLVALPRLAMEWPMQVRSERGNVYLVETLLGVTLAVGVGVMIGLAR
jgi:hypothetical protein